MKTWADSAEFWALPKSEQTKLFNTPCTSGTGWDCPQCERHYRYHCGAPTTGLYAFFYGPDGNELWNGSGCCKDEFHRNSFTNYIEIS